jgi:hypothetical protein
MLMKNTVFSGARAFQLLSREEQEFALNTTVTYAPQAYEYIRHCRSSEDGLTIPTMGKEVLLKELSDFSWDKVAEHPVSLIQATLSESETNRRRWCGRTR